MKRTILLSIKPIYVEKILNKTKRFEFRTKAAKQDVNKIIIYETMPTKKVVAEAEIKEVLKMKPEDLWEYTKKYAGCSKEYFDLYFKNRDVAYAYVLGNITIYDKAKDLSKFGVKAAPQSFVYLD